MPVIGGNTPTVNVTVPVPTPAPMKKPRRAPQQPQQPPQAAPQPVPANPESQQQAVPQGMVPPQPQQPEPRAIILPWAPPPSGRSAMRKMRVRLKYALNEGYQGEHTAPDSQSGAPLHDVTANGIYPEDVYSHEGLRYYGTGEDAADSAMHAKIMRLRGKPKQLILIHRAIPHGLKGAKINRGDWVTLSREYARQHGRSALNGKYRIISKLTNSQDVFTNGDSWHEWGYDPPKGREVKPEQLSRPKKYAANDDPLLNFGMDSMDDLPSEPVSSRSRPPADETKGRRRKQILLDMLRAAQKGHYDPAGMAPSEIIKDLESPKDLPQGDLPQGGEGYLFDPFKEESDEIQKLSRYNRVVTYPRTP